MAVVAAVVVGIGARSRRTVVVALMAARRTMIVIAMVVQGGLEPGHAPGEQDASDECRGELEPIVTMELHLGQQVAAGDAQEDATAEGKRERRDLRIVADSCHEEERTEGHHQREEHLDHHSLASIDAVLAQECRQRHGIEGLVGHDHQQRAQPGQPASTRFGLHTRGERHALHQAVHRQAEQRTHPAKPRRMRVRVGVGVRSMIVLVVTGVRHMTAAAAPAIATGSMLMGMEGSETLQHEQRHEADQGPEHHVHRFRATAVRAERMRQQVEEDDPEDHATDGAQHQLQRGVRQAPGADPSTKQAGRDDERRLGGEHGGWGCGERGHGSFGCLRKRRGRRSATPESSGLDETRTHNLLDATEALYQLSYQPSGAGSIAGMASTRRSDNTAGAMDAHGQPLPS